MANKVEFIDNSVKIKDEIESLCYTFLEEAGAEIESQAVNNTRTQSGQTKRKWGHRVDKSALEVKIGNSAENSIWEEYGTGEYALNGDGRKGGWWICSDDLDPKTRSLFDTKYHFKKRYGKGGKVFYYTKGKKGTRALYKAIKTKKPTIKSYGQSVFKGLGK